MERGTVGRDDIPHLVAGQAARYHGALVRKICNNVVIMECHDDTGVSVFITNNFEEVLILGSLEEWGLTGHLAQVAALAVEFDTLQHNSGLGGLALLRMERWG